MKFEDIKTVSVFGAGLMGNGIAQICALQGYRVFMRDMKEEFTRSGMEAIKKSLGKAQERSIITGDQAKQALALITPTTDMEKAAKSADILVEAIPEKLEMKKEFYRQVDPLAPPEAIFASNTSTLGITELAAATGRPEKFIGMHFFNPVPLMKLVEIIRGLSTSDETVSVAEKLAVKVGKDPVIVRDAPGFITSRLGMALYLEASKVLEAGIATPDAIDKGMRLGYGYRMGPFETCDLVGLDARLNNINAMWESTRDPFWRPPQLLRQLVTAGYLGKKPGSKGGYYTYFGVET
ncbi:MAG: 3-hydroxyacyl-CoA dehydrogenase family protein [Chloroflexota bacterium]